MLTVNLIFLLMVKVNNQILHIVLSKLYFYRKDVVVLTKKQKNWLSEALPKMERHNEEQLTFTHQILSKNSN